jgi:hypothetical protein
MHLFRQVVFQMARNKVDITAAATVAEVTSVPANAERVSAEMFDVDELLKGLAKDYPAASWFTGVSITGLLPTKTGNGNMVRVQLHRPGFQFDQTTYVSFWRDKLGNYNAQDGWEAVRGADGKIVKDANGHSQYKTTEIKGKVISGSTNFGSKKGDGTWYPNQRAVVSLAEAVVRLAFKKGLTTV